MFLLAEMFYQTAGDYLPWEPVFEEWEIALGALGGLKKVFVPGCDLQNTSTLPNVDLWVVMGLSALDQAGKKRGYNISNLALALTTGKLNIELVYQAD